MKSLLNFSGILRNPIIIFCMLCLLSIGCGSNKLAFEYKSYKKKTSLPCTDNCPYITIKIPVATNAPKVADSINKKVYLELKKIISFKNNSSASTDYNQLLTEFIESYEKIQKKYPKDTFGWESEIEGSVIHQSDELLNIKLKYYTYTGGAHGFRGFRSLLFDPATGKSIQNNELFIDYKVFKNFAEKKFKQQFEIPENSNINSTGFLFDDDIFELPQNIFFTEKGLLLYYNTYEIDAYTNGPKELLIPYNEVDDYLILR
ncbi:MAG: PdaC/SigV domain-containing protein [Flavobacterium sp.]